MKNRVFKVRDNCTNEILIWTMEDVLFEINRDRSEEWSDYDETDWFEGWFEWVESDEFYSMIEAIV